MRNELLRSIQLCQEPLIHSNIWLTFTPSIVQYILHYNIYVYECVCVCVWLEVRRVLIDLRCPIIPWTCPMLNGGWRLLRSNDVSAFLIPLCRYTVILLYRYTVIPLYRYIVTPFYRHTVIALYCYTFIPL